MCLYVDEELTQKMKASEEWPKKYWKVVSKPVAIHKEPPLLRSLMRSPGINYQPGICRSNRGIHVFLEKPDEERVKWYQTMYDNRAVLVEVICHKEHFVAAGFGLGVDTNDTLPQAVFTQIELTQESYDAANFSNSASEKKT